jgi:hypothetical protein
VKAKIPAISVLLFSLALASKISVVDYPEVLFFSTSLEVGIVGFNLNFCDFLPILWALVYIIKFNPVCTKA